MKEYIAKFDGENRFLSNFYRVHIVFGDEEYQTSEHAYQASKTTSKYEKELILSNPSPSIAKK